MGSFWRDVRYALRTFARAPGFTAVAVLTLALGIGANTAIFSLFYAVVLKPLPFREPSRLVAAWDTYQTQFTRAGVSPAEIAAWNAQADIFEQTAWYRYVSKDLTLTAPGTDAVEIHATFVSPGFWSTLGIAPAGGTDGAVIGDALWRTDFAGAPNVIGKSVKLNDQAFTIAGVMPASFQFPDWADVWLPPGPMLGDEATNPVRHALGFVGRLRDGVSEAQAAARLQDLSKRLAAEHPKTSTGWGIRVAGLQDDLTAGVRPSLMLLAGAVALVLLIACVNVANLLLARASGREREVSIRAALGAGAWRIARQMLTESVVLACAGGALGILLGAWALAEFSPVKTKLDSTALALAAAITLVTGVVFGLAPALHALRGDTNATMKSGSAGRVAKWLVVAEFALALMLVSSAGILMKSFVRLMRVDPGFDPRGVVTMRVSVPPSRNAVDLFHRIEERVRQLPGVDAVASANVPPLSPDRPSTSRFNVPGSPVIHPDSLPAAQQRIVSPDYFRAMGIPLRSGRAFTERDLNQPVAIINETMARRYWPGRDPVGEKYVSGVWGPAPQYSTIVGVVGDVKQFELDSEPTDDEYFPFVGAAYVIVRAQGDAAWLGPAVRRAIHDVDPEIPVADVRTMQNIVADSAKNKRWTLILLGAFAALALGLALVGIYGVMAWSVARRTREIGIRVALGAGPRGVAWLVLRDGVKLCALGAGIGLMGAFAARRALASFVFGVSTADPWVYGAVIGLMATVAMAACYFPARRASRVDPMEALRAE